MVPEGERAGAGEVGVEANSAIGNHPDVALEVKSSNYSPHAQPILIIISPTIRTRSKLTVNVLQRYSDNST